MQATSFQCFLGVHSRSAAALLLRLMLALKDAASTYQLAKAPAIAHCSFADDLYGSIGYAVLDASAGSVQLGADTLSGSLSVLRTLLMRTTPREILVATSAIPAPLLRFLKSATGGAEITSVPAASMPAPAAAASVLAGKAAYKAIAQVVLALGEAERPSSGLAALIGLLTHLDRLKMLETLSSCVQVRQLCRTVYACRHFHALLNGIAIGRCSSRSKNI